MDIATKIKLLEESKKKIDALTDELKKAEIEKAKTECIYRQALAKKIIELKEQKIAATLIHDLSRGNEQISKLRYNRDIAIARRDLLKIRLKNEYLESEQLRSLLAFERANYLNQ